MKAYEKLKQLNEKYFTLQSIEQLLSHDMLSNMPSNATELRSKQLEILAKLKKEVISNNSWEEIFEECKKDNTLTDYEKINLRETEKLYIDENIIPEELEIELSNCSINATKVWTDVKNNKATFKDLLPYLEKNFDIIKKIADTKSKVLKISPYDCLINQYQKGLTSKQIDKTFNDLKPFLIDLANKNYNKRKPIPLNGNYDLEKKKNFVKKIVETVGINSSNARIDPVLHPHTDGYAPDILLGINYNFDLSLLFYATIHESGHALYIQNLKDYLQPIGQYMGMAIHESQSIFMEKQVGKNENFISFVANIMKDEFGNLPELSKENLLNLSRDVKVNPIRIKADEITFPLHIILRYEIEKDIMENKIKIKDLPEIWNEKSIKYLNVKPKNDVEGCLQDIHWISCNVGYFPSYAFGAIIAAQLMETLRKDLKNVDEDLLNGNLTNIDNWLNINIHSKGTQLDFNELIKNATGKELSTDAFKKDLLNKYK